MITRRKLVIALGAGALVPFSSFAQQPKVWRIGVLSPATAAFQVKNFEPLRAGLRDLSYVEGKNVVFEFRAAETKVERLPDLAAELVRLNVDLIVSGGVQAAIAASRATSTIPIVASGADLVAVGLAASLAKPGGNVTGQLFFNEALNAKALEFLKESIPTLTRVAALLPPDNPSTKLDMEKITSIAKHLKVEISRYTVQGVADFEGAFATMVKQRVGAVLVPNHALMNPNAKLSADLALRHRLPSAGNGGFAEVGGMLGYGVNFSDMYRRSAMTIDKIFKGARPGDLPIEQATTFDMVANLKTAKALGIKIPNSILVRATKVIE